MRAQLADRRDASVAHAQIGAAARRARAVDDPAAGNLEIQLFRVLHVYPLRACLKPGKGPVSSQTSIMKNCFTLSIYRNLQ
ncbi:Uncharacterised protein [Bordetella pertussis]|nr:Uncharacterised protein [Bordetella pertussis]